VDETGCAGTLKGTPNSSSALLSFTLNARLESGVPLEKMPAGCQRSGKMPPAFGYAGHDARIALVGVPAF
jgi:hypothetical protein